jgi:heme/copper-type cytochrome/quinol oxidase subunit 3
MAETTAQPSPELSVAEEEAIFYHEAALNSSWTGTRLALGALSFLFGAFVFAFFYLRSLNSHHLWYPKGLVTGGVAWEGPSKALGAAILACIVVSALVQTLALQRIKAGHKGSWIQGAVLALLLGLAAVGLQVWQLTHLGFWPGSAGFASVFVGFNPVFLTIAFCAMVWLEILIMRCRSIPQISFVEQPPTYAEAFSVQRFQAALSSFTVTWNYLAVVAIIAWILFYLVH